jgi:hypothetical protein
MYAGTVTLEIGANLLTLLMAVVSGCGAILSAVIAMRVRKEVRPNGGLSLRDAVNRIEVHSASVASTVGAPSSQVVPPATPTSIPPARS